MQFPNKRLVNTTLAILLCLGSTCSAATTEDEKPIKIGFLAPLSGTALMGGRQMVNGFQLYLDQISSRSGGRKIQLVVEDDGSNPDQAAEKAKKLIDQDHVDVISGVLFGNAGYSVAQVIDKKQVPTVYSIAASDDLTQRKRSHWLVRTGYSSSQPMHPFGWWVYKKLGYKRVACLGMDYPFSWEQVGGFQKSFESMGGKVIQKIWAPLNALDYSPYLKKVDPQADALFYAGASGATRILVRQLKEQGMTIPIIAGGGSFSDDVLALGVPESKGVYSAHWYSVTLDNPENKKFIADYNAKYHSDPAYYAEGAYVSAMWIDKAISQLHGNISDKEKFMTALRGIKAIAPRGPVSLDEYGNPIENIYVFKVDSQGTKLRNDEVYKFENVSQFFNWTPSEYLKQPIYSRDYPGCKFCTSKN